MAMARKLHSKGQDRFVYTCNNCKAQVETRYPRLIGNDFNTCVNCLDKESPNREKETLGDDTAFNQKQTKESKVSSIKRCAKCLIHACNCEDDNCKLLACQKLKTVVQHSLTCQSKKGGSCNICKQLIAVCCFHSRYCQETECNIPYCVNIKTKLKHQKLQQKLLQAEILKRLVETMENCRISQPNSSSNQPSVGDPSHSPQPDNGMMGSSANILQAGAMIPDSANDDPAIRFTSVDTGSKSIVVNPCTMCNSSGPCVNCTNRCFDPETEKPSLDGSSVMSNQKQTNSHEEKLLLIKICVKYLIHACQCRDINCRLPSCHKIKRVVQHVKSCKWKNHGKCPICKQLIALCCFHAKRCQEPQCPIPLCINIRTKMRHRELQRRLQRVQNVQRHLAIMQKTLKFIELKGL